MASESYVITGVLIPTEDKEGATTKEGYSKFHVSIAGGKITEVIPASEPAPAPKEGVKVIDGTNKMLLPGFVNGHAHSIEQWGRGAIKQLPLELWVEMLYYKIDPRKDPGCPADKVYWSALHCGVETLLSGGTAIMDHLFVRDLADMEAAVNAYKKCGIRAYIAPMLADLERTNYYPLVPDAKDRNAKAKAEGTNPGALGEDGFFREEVPARKEEDTERVFKLWADSVEKFHDPENGINIAIGPMHQWSASDELIERTVALRQKYNLCGHIHLLESRAQKLWSRTKYPDGGAVKKLWDQGWLQLPGTSCAHCCWLEEEEQKLIAKAGAVVVHNPASNTRLGSGIAPIREYLDNGVTVAFGCDGSCSNDGQDLLEAMKFGCILNPLTNADYRKWITPREVVKMAAEGGAVAINMKGSNGEIKPGYAADLVLYDLTSLGLLPRTDPVGLLIMGRPSSGIAGNTVHSVFVRGRLVVEDGVPCHVDLKDLRENLMKEKPEYTDPAITDVTGLPCEVEYRAAMGLGGKMGEHDTKLTKDYPKYRVNYDADMP